MVKKQEGLPFKIEKQKMNGKKARRITIQNRKTENEW